MQITPSQLAAIQQEFNNSFQQGYESADARSLWYQQVAFTAQSSGKESIYGFMSKLPRLREWVGPRIANNLRGQSYAIANKSWELTYAVDMEDLDDNVNLQLYAGAFSMLGQQAALHPNDLMVTLMQDTTSLCFDGLTFFNDAHPEAPGEVGSATYDNNFTSTALTAPNFNTVYAAMMARNGDDHKPLGVRPNLLVVPPQLRSTALTIINAENIVLTAGDGATSNINRGIVDVLVVPELAGQATTWYLLDTSRMIKPFVYQVRQAPQLVSRDQPTDPNVFENREAKYGVYMRDNAGYGLPFLASKCVA